MKFLNYFQGVWVELRKVSWPTMPVLVQNLLSVLLGVAFATVLVGAFDFIFLKLLGLIIK